MFDVIECFLPAFSTKQMKLIVFQTPDVDLAQAHADQLWAGNGANDHPRIPRHSRSSFIVVDRSTARELYRVPR